MHWSTGLAICSTIRETLSGPCDLSVLSEFSFWNTWYSVRSKSGSSMSWSESYGFGSGRFDWSSLVNTDANYLLNSLATSAGFSITVPSAESRIPSCDSLRFAPDIHNKKPSWCWDSQSSVGIFGIFLIFGSNTPTWSVENQLNLWTTNCVVNQTGYFGPLYASRYQTSLWRHQHIYSVQLPQTG